jgi:serine/threonine protein kinase
MSDPAAPSPSPSLTLAARIDRICDGFEAACRGGQGPRIEDYLAEMPEPGRAALLVQLLASELEWRRHVDQWPTPEDYLARFPGQADLIASAFGAVSDRGDDSPATAIAARRTGESPADEWPPRDVPGYEILEELGRGGMGVVYKARHLRLGRVVALKTITTGRFAGPTERARFQVEARSVARLQHPHIVQVYEVGEQEGCPYVTLEFVDGGNLERRLADRPFAADEAARLIQTLARAIHAVHRLGIVHRDLKPANVLLTADGVPKIGDFGLAKLLGDEPDAVVATTLTRTGAVLGTPGYMAPEQAAGQVRAIGPATDIHALGVVFYELLTGHRPFRGPSLMETLDQIRNQEPTPPRALRPGLPRDLETICLKCLKKGPQDRYPDAESLADDLGRYLQGEPIRARNSGAIELLARVLERGQHDKDFTTWSRIILRQVAPFACSIHVGVFLLAVARSPYLLSGLYLLVIGILASQGMVFHLYRSHRISPPSPAAHLGGALMMGQAIGVLATLEVVRRVVDPTLPNGALAVYPFWSIVVGLMFFAMGANFWGRLYLVGLALMALAPLMTLNLLWAPLEFAVCVSLALISCGLHLRRLGREARGADGGGG